MKDVKKNFGQNLEDGLTGLGDGIHRAVVEQKDHELESFKLDLISDVEKLRILKRDLYEAARSRANPEHIQNLRSAIATISQQLELDRKHRTSPVVLFSGLANLLFVVALMTTIASAPATGVCNLFKSHSLACQNFRIIPNAVAKFFEEPK